MAVLCLDSMLREHGISPRIQTDSHEIPPDCDVIFVSSPKGNRQSAKVLPQLNLPFEIRKAGESFYYHDRNTFVDYESPKDRGSEQADIALVARITAPSRDRTFFLVWGVHVLGTLAAARFAASLPGLRAVARMAKRADLAFLVEASSLGGLEITRPQLVTSPRWLENTNVAKAP